MKIYASDSIVKTRKILDSIMGKDLWIKATLYDKHPAYIRVVSRAPLMSFDYSINEIADFSDDPNPSFTDSYGRIRIDESIDNIDDIHWMDTEDIHIYIPIEIYTSDELFSPEDY